MTPLTPAGQALLTWLKDVDELDDWERTNIYNQLCEAERQAADRALAGLRREVEGLRGYYTGADSVSWFKHHPDGGFVVWDELVALIDKASKPEEGA